MPDIKLVNCYIPVPREKYEDAFRFYRDVVKLPFDEYRIATFADSPVEIVLKNVESEKPVDPRGAVRFSIEIERNFLSYCKNIIESRGTIDILLSTPGGYLSEIVDPYGNRFEASCPEWDDENPNIDPNDWPFYRKLD